MQFVSSQCVAYIILNENGFNGDLFYDIYKLQLRKYKLVKVLAIYKILSSLSTKRKLFYTLLSVLLSGFIIPQKFSMPVVGATQADYNPKSFWFYPWGK